MQENFAQALLLWYRQHARTLPWRGQTDAYAVWVSEIMCQQTRVETVIPYYLRWMARFPTLNDLAQASQQAVLAAWEGLGYYSRARSLHRAAQIVHAQHGGLLPAEPEALRRLPGIGRYTAAAIASIAFGKDEATLDGNIRRVLSRLYDVTEPADTGPGERLLWQLAQRGLPTGRAADYNQALMELGAQVCTPRAPDCPACPLSVACQARLRGVQEQRPVKTHRPAAPHHMVTAAVIRRRGEVLIAQRPPVGLLGGLWEFPGGKLVPGEGLAQGLQREIKEELDVEVQVGLPLGVYRHAYTHFRVTLHAFECCLLRGEPRLLEHTDLRWAAPADLPAYPMGKIDRQIAARLLSFTEWMVDRC
jgi:A/G-specific adenine glycosylase